ncbi:13630_t:CDS:2 [Dentiscutata heterogama]|uniref:13630_t:CDS:1 n=1 Tax=Dentiscutata heterogama TaxID=1316150 RepID=A0ACA9LYT4_9GLOM|nr:13630_t:CDS:2 [Dentiscutata heterogama]
MNNLIIEDGFVENIISEFGDVNNVSLPFDKVFYMTRNNNSEVNEVVEYQEDSGDNSAVNIVFENWIDLNGDVNNVLVLVDKVSYIIENNSSEVNEIVEYQEDDGDNPAYSIILVMAFKKWLELNG